jgi:heme oxygenase
MSESTLSNLLRESTRQEHRDAESSPFIVGLMRGALSLDHYTTYLVNMAWLYDALEDICSHGDPIPGSEALWDHRLQRTASITSDLEHLGVYSWRETTRPSAAMASYIAHLKQLGGRHDPRLIAHHYTRYLGDLSGGQAIAALVARHYGATADQLSFYRFAGIDDLVRYKEHYRRVLDSVELTPEQTTEVIDEARSAFRFNQMAFDDLNRQPV